ncbi:hypothetical protein ACQP1S_19425 [Micromonospora matsumotoense]|uniref:hypothetical protein n=1 Tax=Micromonospora matsumotoense TaxID=121616 RepID=UPI003D92C22F
MRRALVAQDARRPVPGGRAGGAGVPGGVPTPVRCADGWTGRAVAVGTGSRRLGALLLAEPVTAGQLAFAGAATTALLIEAVRHESPPPAVRDAATVLRALRDGLGDPAGSSPGPTGGEAGLLRSGETGPSPAGGPGCCGPARPSCCGRVRRTAGGWTSRTPSPGSRTRGRSSAGGRPR